MELLLILPWFVMAVGAGGIAASKGRSGVGYFLLGLLFPLIGLLIAIGVSSKTPVKVMQTQDRQSARGMKKCPACAELVLREAKKCKHCGEVLPELAAAAAGPSASASGTFGQLFPWIVLVSVVVIAAAALLK